MNIGDYITFQTMRELGKDTYEKFREYLRKNHRHVIGPRWGQYEICEADGNYDLVYIDNATDLVAGLAPSNCPLTGTEYTTEMILKLLGLDPKYNVKDKTLSEISEMIRVMREEIKEREKAIDHIQHQIGRLMIVGE